MRNAITADVHAGKHGEAMKYFKEVITGAIQNKCDNLLIGADLYDDLSTPRLRNEMKELFFYAMDNGLNIFGIRGNHESPMDLLHLDNLVATMNNVNYSKMYELPQLIELHEFILYVIPHFNAGRIKTLIPEYKYLTGNEIILSILNDVKKVVKSNDKPVIVLTHGTVDGSMSDSKYIPKDNGIHLPLDVMQSIDAWFFIGHWHKERFFAKNVVSINSPYPHTFAEGEERKGYWIQDIKDGKALKPEFIQLDVPRIFNIKGLFKDKEWKGDIATALEKEPGHYKNSKVKFTYTVRREEIPSVPIEDIKKHFEYALIFDPVQIPINDKQVEIDLSDTKTNEEILNKYFLEKKGLSKSETDRLTILMNHIKENASMEKESK